MLRRRGEAQAPREATVAVGAVDAAVQAGVAEALLHHMLFMRGQIPVPFRQLQQCVDDFGAAEAAAAAGAGGALARGHLRKRSHMRKLQRYVEEMSGVCQGVSELCRDLGTVRSVSFMFGASATVPREMVTLSFSTAAAAAASSTRPDVDGIKRKVVREVIGSFSDLPCINLPSTCLYVSVTCNCNHSTPPPQNLTGEGASLFSIREGFSPTLRRNRGMPLLSVALEAPARAKLDQATLPAAANASASAGDEHQQVVFVLRRAVRGLSKPTVDALFAVN